MPGTATYIVYNDAAGDTRVRRTSDNTDLSLAGHSPEVALQTALDRIDPHDPFSGGPGDVYVQAGRYDIRNEQFPGFRMQSYTNLRMDARAQIRVPNGYEQALFQMLSDDGDNIAGVTNTIIDGGRLTENTNGGLQPQGKWTAFLLKGSGETQLSGMQFNKIANTEVTFANIGVAIIVDALCGYVNSNTFEFLRMTDCRAFVCFEMANLDYTTGNPLFANRFVDLQCDCGQTVRTSIGIQNVAGRQNTFDSVKVWDIQNGTPPAGHEKALTIQISDQAEKTFILDGILAADSVDPGSVEDHGQGTCIFPPRDS